jgi:hypothetical protein
MKTDPCAACANEKECLFWALLHDFLAHPLMALTLYSKMSLRFHDFTSHHAWPRVRLAPMQDLTMHSARFGPIHVRRLGGETYSFQHPTAAHSFVTNGSDAVAALEKAEAWFASLAAEFGGAFAGPSLKDSAE